MQGLASTNSSRSTTAHVSQLRIWRGFENVSETESESEGDSDSEPDIANNKNIIKRTETPKVDVVTDESSDTSKTNDVIKNVRRSTRVKQKPKRYSNE